MPQEISEAAVCLPIYPRVCFRTLPLQPYDRLGQYLYLTFNRRFRLFIPAVSIQVDAVDELLDITDALENVTEVRFGVPKRQQPPPGAPASLPNPSSNPARKDRPSFQANRQGGFPAFPS